jgi:hypothetical protein
VIALVRALAWLRWRLAVNHVLLTARRDAFTRVLRVVEAVVPVLVVVAVIPVAAASAGLGFALGWRLGGGEAWPAGILLARVALAVTTVAAALSAVQFSGRVETSGLARFSLLPIPRRVLFGAQAAATLADVWLLALLPLPAGAAAGMALRGRPGALVLALATVLLAAILALLSTLVALAAHLLLRHRRAGEWSALVGMLVVVAVSVVPTLALDPATARLRQGPWMAAASAAAWLVPSEAWAATAGALARGEAGPAAAGLVRLAATLAVLLAGAWHAFARTLAHPEGGGAARGPADIAFRSRRWPALGAGASAIAQATLRSTLRTVRGRFAVLSAPVVALTLGIVLARVVRGPGAATAGAVTPLVAGLVLAVCVLGLHALVLNQFAVDGPGATLVALSPVAAREVVAGKAAAAMVLVAAVGVLGLGGSALVLPPARALSWAGLFCGLVAAAALHAPAGALLSALLPRTANPNSLGPAGNGHPLAVLVGLPLVALSLGPPVAAVALAAHRRHAVAGLAAAAAWAAVSAGIALALRGPVARLVARRRESILLAAEGR